MGSVTVWVLEQRCTGSVAVSTLEPLEVYGVCNRVNPRAFGGVWALLPEPLEVYGFCDRVSPRAFGGVWAL